MHINLPIVSLSMSDILGIDVMISFVLRNNFAKIHMNSEVILSIILLFGRMLSLVKITKCYESHNFITLSMRN